MTSLTAILGRVMMILMDNKPLEEFPEPGQESQPKPSLFRRISDGLARLGLGETALRFGTNFLSILIIFGVVWLMQFLYRGTVLAQASDLPEVAETSSPAENVLLLPEAVLNSPEGISRQTVMHTTIPSRPRMDVIKYTVQLGDTIFGVADKFNLKPTTILFANSFLADNPNLLSPGQELNILPVDGTYHNWLGSGAETLTGIAAYFGVDPEVIVNFPGNHLDPDTIGDYENPNIPAGTWLIIPGGTRPFTSWTAPAQLVISDPSVRVWGVGVCTGISIVQVGYGTFVFPTTEHWLSGTDYRPDVNHYAVDFAGSLGNAIYAVDAGTVVYAGWNDWGYGNMIMIDHGNGWQTLYAHLSQVNVSCGQNVGQGDVIGLMGSTGNSTGPHLHFEISYYGGKVNPHAIFDIPPR
jgi:murein DD-endopeptidase MepM/ murein hydrolase activator NlpD